MAAIVQTTCRHCGATEEQLDGALMAGYRPRCEDCGKARLVPVQDVAALFGGPIEALEQAVTRLAGTCTCGGRFSTEAPLRCPRCRSTELDVERLGSAD